MNDTARLTHLEKATDFRPVVLESKVPVLVDFYADWCGPCRVLSSRLNQLVEVAESPLRVVKVDIDALPELATRFKVRAVPTLLLFSGGKVAKRKMGVPPLNKLLEMIEAA